MKTKDKKKSVKLPSGNGSSGQLTGVEVAICAYTLWEREGRPPGRDVDHWLRAEAELK